MSMSLRNQILEKLKDKEYRDAFVAEHIYSRIPLKIRALRDSRKMSQTELGEKAGMAQAWVSKLEDPNYGRLTISTLLRIASAFDVGLYVDFVPFSEILNRSTSLSRNSFEAMNFDEELSLGYFEVSTSHPNPIQPGSATAHPEPSRDSNVINIEEYRKALIGKNQKAASLQSNLLSGQAEGSLAYAAISGAPG